MLDAMARKIPADCFVVLTDSETWAGKIHPAQALKQYRERMGIPAKLVVVGMASNGFSIADPNDAGMLDVVGFDATAPNVISDFAALSPLAGIIAASSGTFGIPAAPLCRPPRRSLGAAPGVQLSQAGPASASVANELEQPQSFLLVLGGTLVFPSQARQCVRTEGDLVLLVPPPRRRVVRPQAPQSKHDPKSEHS